MSARASVIRSDTIEYGLQLVFDDQGGARTTRTAGKLAANERAMSITVTLPKSIFKRTSLTATIKVEDNDFSIPPIDISAIQSSLRDAFGADVVLTVNTQELP